MKDQVVGAKIDLNLEFSIQLVALLIERVVFGN